MTPSPVASAIYGAAWMMGYSLPSSHRIAWVVEGRAAVTRRPTAFLCGPPTEERGTL